MNTASQKSISDYLRSYSIDVDYWGEDMGEGHLLLGRREVLHSRMSELSSVELGQLRQLDRQVMDLANVHAGTPGWDSLMLRKTAELIEHERGAPTLKHAA